MAKQRAARLWYKGRTLAMTLKHLRFGFYGGVPRVGMERWATTNVAGCVRTAYDEMDKWIKGDLEHNADGLMGTIEHLEDHAVPRRGRPGRGQGHRDHS